MSRLKDLTSRDGLEDGLSGIGANTWYAEVIAPAPVTLDDDLYVTIPDLNIEEGDGEMKWGPVNWGGRVIPAEGDEVLIITDNRQQMWAIFALADHTP
jgi:hypothetical protein